MSGAAAGKGDDDLGQVWEVVAVAADPTGVIVREGQELTSEKVDQRLTLGAKVKELDLCGERLRFELVAGRGPPTGWVTVKVREKDLLRRTDWRPAGDLADDHFSGCQPSEAGGGLRNPSPDKMKDLYLAPVEYMVLHRQINVYKSPSTQAPVVGKLMRDNKVVGWQQGPWLKLRDAPGGWLLLELGSVRDPAVQLQGFKLEVIRAVSEAANVKWNKVAGRYVQYSVEWAPAEDVEDITTAVERETKASTRIRRLPPESELKVRAVAHILTDDEACGGKVFAVLRSEWEDTETERAVDEVEESNNCVDNFSNFRGKCMDCECDGFVIAGIPEFQQQRVQFEEYLCRRCVCPCVRHTIIGELVVGWNRKKPSDNAQKPQPSSKPFQPPPRAQQALPASAPEAPTWKESDFRRWRPEDAGDGDRVQFVLDCIAQASTLYETLGVAPSAGDKEIRSAYRHISLSIHPDKVQNRGEKELVEQAEAAFKIVCSANDVLSDPSQRASYDRSIRVLAKPSASVKSSRRDLTGISFLKKFLGKVKNNGWDLKQKPKGDWEDEGGGVYVRATGVKATIKHAVSGEELVLKKLDKGISVSMLKKMIVRETKRGPESRIELCREEGSEQLADSCRITQSEVFILVGINLGPPVEVEVCLCHAHTGARLKLRVPDTSSIAEVRSRAAEVLQCPAENLRLGCRGSNRERFQPFEDEELLNGREQLLLLGAEIEMILSVEEATELQVELRDAYGAEWFQKELDKLLEEKPLPECLLNRTFQEEFSRLVQKAQQAILVTHGFDGPKGVFNMYAAFKEVGGHPDVVRLTWEIDQKLRVTTSGRMWAAVPVTLEACKCVHVVLESSTLVNVWLASCFGWSDQPPLRVVLPAQSTVGQVHEAVALKLNANADEFQLVQGEDFEPYDLSEPIGDRRTFKVLGQDLPAEDSPPDARWDDFGRVIDDGELWWPRWMQVSLPHGAAVWHLRQAFYKLVGVDAAACVKFAGMHFEALSDDDPLNTGRIYVFSCSELPEDHDPGEPCAGAETQSSGPRSLKVTVLSHGTVRNVREAIVKELGVNLDSVQLFHHGRPEACDDSEPLGNQRRFDVLGTILPEAS